MTVASCHAPALSYRRSKGKNTDKGLFVKAKLMGVSPLLPLSLPLVYHCLRIRIHLLPPSSVRELRDERRVGFEQH